MSFLINMRFYRHLSKEIWKKSSELIGAGCKHYSTESIITKQPMKCEHLQFSSNYRHFGSVTQSHSSSDCDAVECNENLFDFQNKWPIDIRNDLQRDMIVIENFINEVQEGRLHAEIEKTMKRMRYQYDHWDNAIHGYREMEKLDWLPENEEVFNAIRSRAFVTNTLPHVHILDLAADGIIKPHVDSSRYCGNTIAGLSLLTDCIMRLKRIDENKYKQSREGEDTQTSIDSQNLDRDKFDGIDSPEFDYFVDILLKRRSLYIMKDSARYKFTHEVLPTKSLFKGSEVIKNRRISIICRNAS